MVRLSSLFTRAAIRPLQMLGVPLGDASYIARSNWWLNLHTTVTLVLSFGASVLFANLLPKAEYGMYQYLLSILALLTALTLTGMNSAITRSVAQGHEGSLRASIRPQLLWSLLSVAAALTFSGYYALRGNSMLAVGSLLIAVALPIVTTFNSYGAYLAGKQAFRSYFVISTTANILYYACIVAVVLLFPDALALLFANLLITSICAVIAYAYTVWKYKPASARDPDLTTYGQHLSFLNFFGTVAAQIDNFLVFHFLGPVQLAVYSIATLIPERLGGFLKNLTTSMLPRFSEQSFATIRASLFRTAIAIALAISVIVMLYAAVLPLLFSLVYPQYAEAIPYSQVFALTLFVAVGNFIGTPLMAHRRLRRIYALNTVLPIIQIVLQVGGILLWGLWGLIFARIATTALFILATIPLIRIGTSNGTEAF